MALVESKSVGGGIGPICGVYKKLPTLWRRQRDGNTACSTGSWWRLRCPLRRQGEINSSPGSTRRSDRNCRIFRQLVLPAKAPPQCGPPPPGSASGRSRQGPIRSSWHAARFWRLHGNQAHCGGRRAPGDLGCLRSLVAAAGPLFVRSERGYSQHQEKIGEFEQ